MNNPNLDFTLIKKQVLEIVELNLAGKPIIMNQFKYANENAKSFVKIASDSNLNNDAINVLKQMLDIIEVGIEQKKDFKVVEEEAIKLLARSHMKKVEKVNR